MSWPHEEVKVSKVSLDGHLIGAGILRENHSAFGKIDPDVDCISSHELESLNRRRLTTLGCEL